MKLYTFELCPGSPFDPYGKKVGERLFKDLDALREGLKKLGYSKVRFKNAETKERILEWEEIWMKVNTDEGTQYLYRNAEIDRPYGVIREFSFDEDELVPNRKVYMGDLRTIITFHNNPNEEDPEYGYYTVDITVIDSSRIIRKEQIVTDNLNISEE